MPESFTENPWTKKLAEQDRILSLRAFKRGRRTAHRKVGYKTMMALGTLGSIVLKVSRYPAQHRLAFGETIRTVRTGVTAGINLQIWAQKVEEVLPKLQLRLHEPGNRTVPCGVVAF